MLLPEPDCVSPAGLLRMQDINAALGKMHTELLIRKLRRQERLQQRDERRCDASRLPVPGIQSVCCCSRVCIAPRSAVKREKKLEARKQKAAAAAALRSRRVAPAGSEACASPPPGGRPAAG